MAQAERAVRGQVGRLAIDRFVRRGERFRLAASAGVEPGQLRQRLTRLGVEARCVAQRLNGTVQILFTLEVAGQHEEPVGLRTVARLGVGRGVSLRRGRKPGRQGKRQRDAEQDAGRPAHGESIVP